MKNFMNFSNEQQLFFNFLMTNNSSSSCGIKVGLTSRPAFAHISFLFMIISFFYFWPTSWYWMVSKFYFNFFISSGYVFLGTSFLKILNIGIMWG